VEALTEKLKENGFGVLSKTEVLDGETVISITNDQLKQSNSFLSVLNILVDKKREIRVQNPTYFGAAYLGDKFVYGQFSETLKSLQKVLGDMYETEDILAYSKLKEFSFQPGMAHYADFVEIAEGKNLSEKLGGEKSGKYIAYALELPNGNILVGHRMRPRINRFLTKIEEEKNAQLLPYQSMIEKERVIMLDPTYYLALSMPLLSMEEFMKIATTPDEIAKGIGRVYR
jgi:hypothetical protein